MTWPVKDDGDETRLPWSREQNPLPQHHKRKTRRSRRRRATKSVICDANRGVDRRFRGIRNLPENLKLIIDFLENMIKLLLYQQNLPEKISGYAPGRESAERISEETGEEIGRLELKVRK